MSRWRASNRRLTPFFIAAAVSFVTAFVGLASLVGQEERTANVRGVVVDEAGVPVPNSRVAVHPPTGRKIEAAAPTGEFTIQAPLIGNEMMLSAQSESGERQ